MKYISLFTIIVTVSCASDDRGWTNQFELSVTPPEIQESTVRRMLSRLLPNHHQLFKISVDPNFGLPSKETFRILSPSSDNSSTISIVGTTGIAASAGILHFLKYFCNSHISWEANNINIPTPLPLAQVKISTTDRFRYYQNVCTSSYSFVWWDWPKWETHIDWMALNGINFPLALTAQEAIWRKVYLKLNFTQDDLDEHFTGPGFLAWGRMGNIKSWGGPLSEHWHERSLDLQKNILRRMRDFGMMPILPAFAGHVPEAIIRIYPEANVTHLPAWINFVNRSLTRTYLLDPKDPLFPVIGKMFISEMIIEYNTTDHYYNCDPFNEVTPPSSDPKYLNQIGASIYNAMTEVDPDATWVMQGWLFRYKFWTNEASKAILTSVPQGKMIVLDLYAETSPQYIRLESFYGQPFIFCMLHDFGGVNGLYGNVEMLLKNLEMARNYPNVTLIGTGISPEGINQNYVMYDLMLELAWRKSHLNYRRWAVNYSHRRYGSMSKNLLGKAWKLLINSIYNCHDERLEFHGKNILIAQRPNLRLNIQLWYNVTDIVKAWDFFIKASYKRLHNDLISQEHDRSHNISYNSAASASDGAHEDTFPETFKHDLVDLTREVLEVYGGVLVQDIRSAYRHRAIQVLRKNGNELMALMSDLEKILLTSKDFLLGKWLKDAANCGITQKQKHQYLRNALHQLTLWGPNGELTDYAIKQWNGIVGKYMKPRWKLFIYQLESCVENGTKFNQTAFDLELFEKIEKPFALGVNTTFPEEIEGDPIRTAIKYYKKYRNKLMKNKRTHQISISQKNKNSFKWNSNIPKYSKNRNILKYFSLMQILDSVIRF